MTSNGGIEYATLAHYTVKEFLYSERITHSGVSSFALSDYLVVTAFSEMVFKVVNDRLHEIEVSLESLHFYCLAACVAYSIRQISRDVDTVLRNDGLQIVFGSIAERLSYLQKRLSYIRQLTPVIRQERVSISEYGSAASRELPRR